jgi:transposase
MKVIRAKRSASRTVDCAGNRAEPHAEAPRGALSAKRRQTMHESITAYVRLDVHKDSIAVAVAGNDREVPHFVGTVRPDVKQVRKALSRYGSPSSLQVVYEAGPCGYTLARQLLADGFGCQVIAASRITRSPTERIKTDRRDALTLARLARSGDLIAVRIPDERDEAVRDLSRARQDAVRACLKARQQLKAFLLRHGRPLRGSKPWSATGELYLSKISFAHPAQNIAFADYRQAVLDTHARVERLTEALRAQCENWRMQPLVSALACLRGVDFLTALILVAEIGDFTRFAHPKELMGYLGLVPSEYSTGERHHRGDITKTGNAHARRVLVEAAWNYRFPARLSHKITRRQEGQSKPVRDIAWKAQLRLGHRYRRLQSRKLHQNKIIIAIARELSGFLWDIARQVPLAA